MRKILLIVILFFTFAIVFAASCGDNGTYAHIDTGTTITYYCTGTSCGTTCSPNSAAGCETSCKPPPVTDCIDVEAYYNFDGQYVQYNDQVGPNFDDGHAKNTVSKGAGVWRSINTKDNSIYLNGSGYVEVPSSGNFDLNANQSFSISLWVKTTTTDTYDWILSRYGFSSSPNGSEWYGFFLTNGTPNFIARGSKSSTGNEQTVSGGGNIRGGKWHHLVGIVDKNNKLVKLYVDNTLVKSKTFSTLKSTNSPGNKYTFYNDPLRIGRYEGTTYGNSLFNGNIDEVYFIKKAITAQDVNILYEGHCPKKISGCTPQYENNCDTTDGCGVTREVAPFNGCDLSSDTSCGTETLCDGLDNDCDGTIDGITEPCDSGMVGICAPGISTCTAGIFSDCIPNIQPATLTEICDGTDNDCDGLIDEDFQCINSAIGNMSDGCTDECKIGVTQKNSIKSLDGKILGPRKISTTVTCVYDSIVNINFKNNDEINIGINPIISDCNDESTTIEIIVSEDLNSNTLYSLTNTLAENDCGICAKTIYLEDASGITGTHTIVDTSANGSGGGSIPDNNPLIVLLLLLIVSIILTRKEKV